jgi:hypothetical protein
MRIEAAREDDRPADHRRDVRGHRLPEHMTEWQQVQKPQRMKRTRVVTVFHHFAFNRDDVREHVPVTNHDTFRFGGGAGSEDDLRDVVTRDVDVRHWSVRAPVDVGELPEKTTGVVRIRVPPGVIADEHDARVNKPAHLHHEFIRRAVVDRNDDDTGDDATPVADDPFRAVLAPEDDLVVLLDAGVAEPCRERARGASNRLVAVSAPPIAVVVYQELAANRDEVAEEVDERLSAHCSIMMAQDF